MWNIFSCAYCPSVHLLQWGVYSNLFPWFFFFSPTEFSSYWVVKVLNILNIYLIYLIKKSMEFSRQEYWSGLPFPSPGDLPNPGIKPRSPTSQVDFYQLSHQGSPSYWVVKVFNIFWMYILWKLSIRIYLSSGLCVCIHMYLSSIYLVNLFLHLLLSYFFLTVSFEGQKF